MSKSSADLFVEENVVGMAKAGFTAEQIHADFDFVPFSRIYRLAAAAGIRLAGEEGEARGPQREHILKNLEAMKEDYYAGMSLREFCEKWNVSRFSWYGALNSLGLDVRAYTETYKAAKEAQLEEAVSMYEGGAKIVDIYLETKVSQGKLYLELRRRGVPLRRGK